MLAYVKRVFNLVIDVKAFQVVLLEEINNFRTSPEEYAKTVERHMQYLVVQDSQSFYINEDFKIHLKGAEAAFRNCIELLGGSKPLKKLEFNDAIRVSCSDKIIEHSNYEPLVKELKEKYIKRKIGFNYDVSRILIGFQAS